MSRSLVCVFFFVLSGCGLALDLAPPEPDAAVGRFDAQVRDAGEQRCRGPADCGADDNVCNGIERCDLASGACLIETISCPASSRCFASSCDPVLGCVDEPIDCPDDLVDCTDEICREDSAGCESVPNDALCLAVGALCMGAMCDPVDGCVAIDLCGPFGTCNETTGNCNFGVRCAELCAPIGLCAMSATCDLSNECVQQFAAEGATCNPNACVTGICNNEHRCRMRAPVVCPDDGNDCTLDVCVPSADGCANIHRGIGVACDTDGDACTLEACGSTSCDSAGDIMCIDPDPTDCISELCDSSSGLCVPRTNAADTTCDDLDPCTGSSICDPSGTCISGSGGSVCLDASAPRDAAYDGGLTTNDEAGVMFP